MFLLEYVWSVGNGYLRGLFLKYSRFSISFSNFSNTIPLNTRSPHSIHTPTGTFSNSNNSPLNLRTYLILFSVIFPPHSQVPYFILRFLLYKNCYNFNFLNIIKFTNYKQILII